MSRYEIGDYIITDERIGKGAYASIYIGYHKKSLKKIAVKKYEVDDANKIKKHIKREINLHKSLNHENIIKIYDVHIDYVKNNIYIFMELCEGGEFSKFQEKKPLKEQYIQKYMRELRNGLKYLIDNNIIHRDLKPQNILLTTNNKNGVIKLTDFGFAKNFNTTEPLKQTYCGSPMYMSPEVLHYEKYNIKSDLWSVGVILYEMITGNPPYHVKNFVELRDKINSNDDIKLPLKFENKISVDLCDLLYGLLQKKIDNRISWDGFFYHKWFNRDLLLERENALLNISITNTLPSLSVIENDNNIYENYKSPSLDFDISSYDGGDNFYESSVISTKLSTDSHQPISTTKPIDIPGNKLNDSLGFSVVEENENNDESITYFLISPKSIPSNDELHRINKKYKKQYEKNSIVNILNNSYYYLKESFDYLNSNNKSI